MSFCYTLKILLRAPEVALSLPITEVIDVWGVGLVLAFLVLAENLVPVDCDYSFRSPASHKCLQPSGDLSSDVILYLWDYSSE